MLAHAAQAADDKKSSASSNPSMSQSGSAKSSASAEFDRLDKNKDGQISRAEFEARASSSAGSSKAK